jgi:hypothetical protein
MNLERITPDAPMWRISAWIVADPYIGPKRPVWGVSAHLDHMAAFIVFLATRGQLGEFRPMAKSFRLEGWQDRTQVRPSLCGWSWTFFLRVLAREIRAVSVDVRFKCGLRNGTAAR